MNLKRSNDQFTTNDKNEAVNKDDQDKNSSDDSLTYFQMICFGVPGFTFQIMCSAISVFATKFLLDVMNIRATYTTIIFFTSKAVDAITDPVYAYFVTLTKFTRFGKNKPW